MTGRALVVIDHADGVVPQGQLGVLALARSAFSTVETVLFGLPDPDVAQMLGAHGASVVHRVTDAALTQPLAHPRVEVVASLHHLEPFDAILFESSSLAADVSAALAVRLGAGVNWDLVGLTGHDGALVGTRMAIQDAYAVRVGWVGKPAIAVFRAGIAEPEPRPQAAQPAEVREICGPAGTTAGPLQLLRRTQGESAPSGLDSAEVVVAGGRGLGGPQSISLLEQLADVLGGVVGVSMPVVDKGWYPYANQVGQTGRTVRPKLYVACGISGAIQHRVGMAKSGTIVAVNTDRDAPIFGICDFGVVGDLNEVLPRVTELLRRRKGHDA